jgi:NAD(P)-dependent dehydrogenase (short-subunit alcohol dehydrogenase family)
MGELDGKIAVVTGAGSGIGRASARLFVREGARVLAVDLSGREDETAAELGDAALPFRCDVTQERDVEAMYAAAVEAFGRVDAVLNVAGVVSAQPLADVTLEEYDRVIAVNLTGVMLSSKHGIRAMLASGGGAIVNMSSAAGITGSVLPISAYSASKAGVIALTKAAAVEYADRGIRANAICPGFVETEMSGGAGAAAQNPQVVQAQAMKRGAHPDEIAEVASFLASDRASFLTGAIIPVDGGLTAFV